MSTNNPGGSSPSPYDPSGSGQQPASPYEPGQAPQQPAPPYGSGQQPASPYEPGQAPAQPASPYQQSPYQQQPGATPYPAAPGYPAQYGGQPFPKNDLGVWALVLGIVSIVMCGFVAGIPAVIVGNKARHAVRNGEADNDGMALAGVITGWIGTALSILVIVFYTIIIAIGVSGGFDSSPSGY
ncbi:DUF4190 domain-containing protein [Myceligenerans indicum]|uniref:DUF4190 domain-containing protein n=1 Tax=Myceligenerans indicum TaxID=2593663 RepID=A0ABS1LI94_9MICO|nr:DUF4190 domain-containing protein [Myceligenerans indicum]MBL0885774.1 DUF4190 domain-containing protein [Myceligenerans indicum]